MREMQALQLGETFPQIQEGETKELNLIIKVEMRARSAIIYLLRARYAEDVSKCNSPQV